MVDRQPTHAGRVHLEPVSGQQNTFDMSMADGATEQGTPLNKATFLKDATAALYGLPNTAVPDDALAVIGNYIENDAVKIETGSYVGTGTYGESNPNSLTFGFVPKLVIVTLLGGMKFASGAFGYDSFIWIFGNTSVKIYNSTARFALSQNTLSWYSTSSAKEQCNGANNDYFYIAIG